MAPIPLAYSAVAWSFIPMVSAWLASLLPWTALLLASLVLESWFARVCLEDSANGMRPHLISKKKVIGQLLAKAQDGESVLAHQMKEAGFLQVRVDKQEEQLIQLEFDIAARDNELAALKATLAQRRSLVTFTEDQVKALTEKNLRLALDLIKLRHEDEQVSQPGSPLPLYSPVAHSASPRSPSSKRSGKFSFIRKRWSPSMSASSVLATGSPVVRA